MLPQRPSPAKASQAQANGSLLIDIRGDDQRRAGGLIPGAIDLARNTLEWRCDRASAWRHPAITSRDVHLILFCQQGYQSSLAAATLQGLGLIHATDLDGGFAAWATAGFPVAAAATGHLRALADPGGPYKDPACSSEDVIPYRHRTWPRRTRRRHAAEPVTPLTANGVDAGGFELASSLSNTALQIGTALGVAIASTVAVSRSKDFLAAHEPPEPVPAANSTPIPTAQTAAGGGS